MGPSVKFVLAIIDSILNQKKRVLIFFRKVGHKGGGGGFQDLVSRDEKKH